MPFLCYKTVPRGRRPSRSDEAVCVCVGFHPLLDIILVVLGQVLFASAFLSRLLGNLYLCK